MRFRVSAEVLKSQVKFVNQLRAGAFSKIFQVGKDLDEVILRALLPDDFRHPAVSKADCANLPNARHFRGLLDAR